MDFCIQVSQMTMDYVDAAFELNGEAVSSLRVRSDAPKAVRRRWSRPPAGSDV